MARRTPPSWPFGSGSDPLARSIWETRELTGYREVAVANHTIMTSLNWASEAKAVVIQKAIDLLLRVRACVFVGVHPA